MSAELLALGKFLRARRNVCQPEDAGLFREPGRRVPGLRRDEVARLAGISEQYYLRLEQGRNIRPSDQVLNALARALGFDADTRQYMFRVASGDLPNPAPPATESADRIARVLSQWTHTPAYVSDSNRDIVASNPMATNFGHGGLAAGSNVVVDLFNDRMKKTLLEWEPMVRSTVAGLRRDANPFAPRLKELVEELSADADFVRIWNRYDVSGREDAHIHMVIENVGTIEIEVQNFAMRSMPGYLLTVLAAPPQSVTAVIFASLAASLTAPTGENPTQGERVISEGAA
ncbi:helix-turn-helix transcriptional regulator [Herbiconiux ginsengi]|uniref:Helix-turn-helix domain-containing protein n=1 Tax=Herbiconiux ginsengi TaxID=381665 RepID=A0A1H3T0J2_9MICO|nr:helix-turn-helix transcriptional regulator [Herbiconiux ginsengi]SDZ43477.1 Helix-turn-helix domain-containing protein [Herbiconiux ginsengi]